MSDPLAGYHVGWQDEPEAQDPLAGYTPDWRKRLKGGAAVAPPPAAPPPPEPQGTLPLEPPHGVPPTNAGRFPEFAEPPRYNQFGEPMNDAAREEETEAAGTRMVQAEPGGTPTRTFRTAALGEALGAGKAVLGAVEAPFQALGAAFARATPEEAQNPLIRGLAAARGGAPALADLDRAAAAPPTPGPSAQGTFLRSLNPLPAVEAALELRDPEAVGGALAMGTMGAAGFAKAPPGVGVVRGAAADPEAVQAFAHLGLDPATATPEDVQAAFREAAQRTHPDVAPEVRAQRGGPTDPLEAAQQFAAASNARDVALEALGRAKPAPAPTPDPVGVEETFHRAKEAEGARGGPPPAEGPASSPAPAATPPTESNRPGVTAPEPPARSPLDLAANEARELSILKTRTPEQQARLAELQGVIRAAPAPPLPPLEESGAAPGAQEAHIAEAGRRMLEKERRKEQVSVAQERRAPASSAPSTPQEGGEAPVASPGAAQEGPAPIRGRQTPAPTPEPEPEVSLEEAREDGRTAAELDTKRTPPEHYSPEAQEAWLRGFDERSTATVAFPKTEAAAPEETPPGRAVLQDIASAKRRPSFYTGNEMPQGAGYTGSGNVLVRDDAAEARGLKAFQKTRDTTPVRGLTPETLRDFWEQHTGGEQEPLTVHGFTPGHGTVADMAVLTGSGPAAIPVNAHFLKMLQDAGATHFTRRAGAKDRDPVVGVRDDGTPVGVVAPLGPGSFMGRNLPGGATAYRGEEEVSRETAPVEGAPAPRTGVPEAPRGESAGEPTGPRPEPVPAGATGGTPGERGAGGGTGPRAERPAAPDERPLQPEKAREPSAVRGEPATPGPGTGAERPDLGAVEVRQQGTPGPGRGANYRITADDHLGAGGLAAKARDNVAAIRLLKALAGEGAQATPEQQAQLVKYVGWGALPQAFNVHHPELGRIGRELTDLLTPEEYEAARGSTPNAHYTSEPVIRSIFDGLKRLGVATDGRFLEPAAGVGHFLGLGPAGLKWTAIELDHTTAQILKQLYPHADVRQGGFEDQALPDNFYHGGATNVPFGNYSVHDPLYNKYAWPIHNYFIVKMLDKLRPGGVLAAVTSMYAMDATSHEPWREYVAKHADLLGAIRLPNDAFQGNAGTEVTTDILFLRKRLPGAAPAGEAWTHVERGTADIPRNEYYRTHPEMMLGEMALRGTMYRSDEPTLVAREGEDLTKALADAIARLPEGAARLDVLAPTDQTSGRPAGRVQGGYQLTDEGKLVQVDVGGNQIPVESTKAGQIKAMVKIRDAARRTLTSQADDLPEKEQAAARKALNTAYDSFQKQYGPLNKLVRSGTGLRRPNLEVFQADPDVSLLASLENVDEERDAYTKADIFSKRVIDRQPPIVAETAADALTAVLNETGKVDLARMSELLHRPQEAVREEARGLLYENPETEGLETANDYLSGNVRAKLAAAQKAAKVDPKYAENVKALEAVQPEDVPPSQIQASPGSPWIGPEDVQTFIDETLGKSAYREKTRVTYLPVEAAWSVKAPYDIVEGAKARSEWGTQRASAVKLIEDALNQIATAVYDRDAEGKAVLNEKETIAAREFQQRLKDRFGQWVWEDDARSKRLHRYYNDHFNNYVEPKHDGSYLTLPGSSSAIKLLPHQLNAIARGLAQKKLGLFQVVGAGKSFEMAALAMESKRLGLTHKPMLAVPNHLIGQVQRDFLRLYPAAKILVADDKSFSRAGAAGRKEFTARVATGNWDAVLITHSSFGRIPMSKEFETDFIRDQLAQYEDAAREAKAGRNRDLTKLIEKGKKRLLARLKQIENREAKDDLLPFEQLGVDHLLVDEAQAYKNLYFMTKMRNVPGAGQLTQRSMDLYLKARYLDQAGGRLVLATGTPISNTISEMYTMQRYLQPELLRERGIEHFDAWAAAFGEARTALELAPSGSGYRMNTRFAYFKNVGELAQMFRAMADVKTAEDLKLPVPKLRGGKPETVVVPGTDELKAYQEALVKRAADIKARKVDPSEDNMLKVTHDGRFAALDMRLVAPDLEMPPDTKITKVADQVHRIWDSTKPDRSTQMIFVNAVKPGYPKFDVYGNLKRELVDRGIPADEIAFIHDADTDAKKETLFRRVREGRVRVLAGSIQKMGMGTNVQDRLLALHHVDAPWRPADIEQGDGRILRRGNRNPEVQIYHYVTEGSFDSYIWQMLERKARSIDQMMKAEAGTRTIEDVDGRALTFAEIKAISTGNPLVMEKATVDAEVQRLSRLASVHRDRQFRIKQDLAAIPDRITAREHHIENTEADIQALQDVSGDKFAVKLGNDTFTERAKAGARLVELGERLKASSMGDVVRLGKFAGLDLNLDLTVSPPRLTIQGKNSYGTNLPETADGAVKALEYLPKRLPTDLQQGKDQLTSLRTQSADLMRLRDEPFPQAGELEKLAKRQQALNEQLDLNKSEANEVAEEADIPDAGTEAAADAPETVDLEDALERASETAEEADPEPMPARMGQQLREGLIAKLGLSYAEQEAMSDEDVAREAVKRGLIDDVTERDLLEQVQRWAGPGENPRAGFAHATRPEDDDAVTNGLTKADGPHVFAEKQPEGLGFISNYFLPPSWAMDRLTRSKNPVTAAAASTGARIVRLGQMAHLALSRYADQREQLVQQTERQLDKAGLQQLDHLLRTVPRTEDLPAGTNAQVAASHAAWRRQFLEDKRLMGQMRRLTLRGRSKAMLDAAMAEWPEGTPAPDFDTTPVNRRRLLELAADAGFDDSPTTVEGWEALHAKLKAEGYKVAAPAFMESPDLRTTFQYLRGEGGIAAYAPEVYMGDWKVRAGPHTARFTDRMDAIQYARSLLENGTYGQDIHVLRDAYVPDYGVYLSRKGWLALRSQLERAAGEDAATVAMQAGKIKIRPRGRFFAHGQQRVAHLDTYEKEFGKYIRTYNWRLSRYAAFTPFRHAATDLMESMPVDGGWRDWAEAHIAGVQGVPGELTTSLNNTLTYLFRGVGGPIPLQTAAGVWQRMTSMWLGGYNPVWPTLHAIQYLRNVPAAFETDGHRWAWKGLQELVRGSDESKAAIDAAGVRFQHPSYAVSEYLPRGIGGKGEQWWHPMWMFNTALDAMRSATVLAKYYEQRAAGRTVKDAQAAATQFVRDTYFDFSMANAPRVMRNPLGRTLGQLQLYGLNQMLFDWNIFRQGNWRQRSAWGFHFWAWQGLKAIAATWPLFVLNWMLGKTGAFRDKNGQKDTPWGALWDRMGPVHPMTSLAFGKYGVLGLFGINLSEHVGMLGQSGWRMPVPVSMLRTAADALTDPLRTRRAAASRQLAPVVVQRLMKAAQVARDHNVKDASGRVVQDSASTADAVRQGLGFQSVAQSERSEQITREMNATADYKDARAGWLDKVVKAYEAGGWDQASAVLEQARKDGVYLTGADVRRGVRTADQSDLQRRAQRTPKVLRPSLGLPPKAH